MMPASATKAETLRSLRDCLGPEAVPPFVYFGVGAWLTERRALVTACLKALRGCRLAVRSACRGEDATASGLAGHFRTELDVAPESGALAAAVDRVIAVYPQDGVDHHVLVQAMVADGWRSGVVATRDPATGAPYWVLELATGAATDVVTSGRGDLVRIAVHHAAPTALVARAGCSALVAAARAVEDACRMGGCEIELVERERGGVAVLQARPLPPFRGSTSARGFERSLASIVGQFRRIVRPRRHLAGASTILGLMPDWNPAELLGVHPSPLALGMFRVLVADRTWHEARAELGYQRLRRAPLVRVLAGRPYVDVRASFNSFLPAGLPRATRAALVDAWLAHLREAPALHDRVELEVATTVRDCGVLRAEHTAVPGLDAGARATWSSALTGLTAAAIASGGSLDRALRELTLPVPRPPAALPDVLAALVRCRVAGARPFAIVARHAFMAERMLRSLVERGVLAPERLTAFRRSLVTVAGRFAADWRRVACGALPRARLVAGYGHLRPGAFDVASLPYALRPDELWRRVPAAPPPVVPFVSLPSERRGIDVLLAEAGLPVETDALLAWAARAIVGREEGKFLFNRRLSSVLEALADWGAAHDLDRDALALLDLRDLARTARSRQVDRGSLLARIAATRARRERERAIRLGVVLRGEDDFSVVWEPPALPSFVTDRTVVAPPAVVDGRSLGCGGLAGRIILIESADPGFDWIFGCGIAGLVTRFGGGNSHMAVRCHELDMPAALGVGERAFERLARAVLVELRCDERVVRDAGPSREVEPAGAVWCAR